MVANRPKSFTSAEKLIEQIREDILTSKDTYKVIAVRTGKATSTIANIASGKTRWPRDTTLFPLIAALGKTLYYGSN